MSRKSRSLWTACATVVASAYLASGPCAEAQKQVVSVLYAGSLGAVMEKGLGPEFERTTSNGMLRTISTETVATVLAKRLSETRISAPMRPSGKLRARRAR